MMVVGTNGVVQGNVRFFALWEWDTGVVNRD